MQETLEDPAGNDNCLRVNCLCSAARRCRSGLVRDLQSTAYPIRFAVRAEPGVPFENPVCRPGIS
jgi:hypothetical protein